MWNGYAVLKEVDGGSYHGQWVDDNHEGYGMMKWENKDEYHGQWKNHDRNGEGIFKNGASGMIKRAIWENDKRVSKIKRAILENDKRLKVLEIIKQ